MNTQSKADEPKPLGAESEPIERLRKIARQATSGQGDGLVAWNKLGEGLEQQGLREKIARTLADDLPYLAGGGSPMSYAEMEAMLRDALNENEKLAAQADAVIAENTRLRRPTLAERVSAAFNNAAANVYEHTPEALRKTGRILAGTALTLCYAVAGPLVMPLHRKVFPDSYARDVERTPFAWGVLTSVLYAILWGMTVAIDHHDLIPNAVVERATEAAATIPACPAASRPGWQKPEYSSSKTDECGSVLLQTPVKSPIFGFTPLKAPLLVEKEMRTEWKNVAGAEGGQKQTMRCSQETIRVSRPPEEGETGPGFVSYKTFSPAEPKCELIPQ